MFHYTRSSQQVAVSANVTWDSAGKVTWDAVDHCRSYVASLYRMEANEYKYVTGKLVWNCGMDFSSDIAQGYFYAVKISAISADVNEYANSGETDYIVMDNSGSKEEVNSKLDEAVKDENLTQDKINATIAGVKKEFSNSEKKNELQIAMQQDPGTQAKISTLEKSYSENKGVSVTADAGNTGEILLLSNCLELL